VLHEEGLEKHDGEHEVVIARLEGVVDYAGSFVVWEVKDASEHRY
jgi:hypothetical protein